MRSRWIVMGALLGATAVMFGAFGAHALSERLVPARLANFEVAARYHLIHALAVVIAGILASGDRPGARWATRAAGCLTAGIVIFSGSLYALALSGVTKLGMITPIGGLLLIAGWICLAVSGRGESPRATPP